MSAMDKQEWVQHFLNGKYDQCIDALRNLAFKCFCLEEVKKDFNEALCRHLQSGVNSSLGDETSTEDPRRESSNSFQDALQQMANNMNSLSPTLHWLPLELTVCYNYMYVSIATTSDPGPSTLHYSSISFSLTAGCSQDWLSSCLDRALRALRRRSGVHPKASVLEKVKILLKSAETLHACGALVPLMLCGCLESVHLMQDGCLADAQALLQLFGSCCSAILEVPLPLVRGLLPAWGAGAVPDLQSPSLSSLLSLLQALCFLRCYDNSAARQHLERVEFGPWQPAAVFFQASLLLESGSAGEAAAMLERLLYGGKPVGVTHVALKARLLHLMAKCYFSMGLHQRSTHALQSALEADSAFLLPLYTLSTVYRLQRLDNAELEALNLLVTMLEEQETQSLQSSSPGHEVFLEGVLFSPIFSQDSISLLHARYAMARRCLQLERFQEAAEQYVNILAAITGAVSMEMVKCSHITLPTSSAIFVECGASLLASGALQDCLAVCRKALQALADLSPLDLLTSPSPPSQDARSWLTQATTGVASSSRKRSRPRDVGSISILDAEDLDDATLLQHRASLLLCKAQALGQLERRAEAKEDVQNAMELLEQCSRHTTGGSLSTQALGKRQRKDSGSVEDSPPPPLPDWQQKLSKACGMLASLLSADGARQEALRFHQLAVQYDPGSTAAWYGCCKALQDFGRGREAAEAWLKHRGIDASAPVEPAVSRLQQQLDARAERGGNVDPQVVVTETAALQMDFASLQCLQTPG